MRSDPLEPLRRVVAEWDPLGVAGEAPDEYDCLLGPLASRLHHGADAAVVARLLRRELAEHFGLDPAGADVDEVAARLVRLRYTYPRKR